MHKGLQTNSFKQIGFVLYHAWSNDIILPIPVLIPSAIVTTSSSDCVLICFSKKNLYCKTEAKTNRKKAFLGRLVYTVCMFPDILALNTTSFLLFLLSAMRPRSRLLSKRRLLLPTIREGTEETVRDLNEANTLHFDQAVSSEDYLLSICHLAHPTFPTRDVSPYNSHTRQLDAVHQRLRLSRLSGTPSGTLGFDPTEEGHVIDMQLGRGKELDGELTFGNSDPLEYLYGHQDNLPGGIRGAFGERRFRKQHGGIWECQARARAHSIPHASSPDLSRQRKSSCPELHSGTSASIPNISPKHSRKGRQADRGAEGERRNPAVKQSLISQWISDCRSAWREARTRACMLPTIAEI